MTQHSWLHGTAECTKRRETIFYSRSRVQIPANKINLPHKGLASLLPGTSTFLRVSQEVEHPQNDDSS